jgi:RNA polymerase-interacting CarD/CdnL/TRCF family regulator
LRLLPPSDIPQRDLPANFGVGDIVVYASYGIGRVESMRPASADPQTITLAFANGLTVILPVDRAFETLRPVSDESELDDVGTTLRAIAETTTEPWTRRHRRMREKVTSGRAAELAEVVRDGILREQVRAAKGGGTPAPSDRQLYLQARALLAAEIALCRGIEPDEADAWIVAQVAEPAKA